MTSMLSHLRTWRADEVYSIWEPVR